MRRPTQGAHGAQDGAESLKGAIVKSVEWSSFKTDEARLTAFLVRELRILMTILAVILGSLLR